LTLPQNFGALAQELAAEGLVATHAVEPQLPYDRE
jgi:hypothetical protein